jgi:hypothetical protein
MMLKFHINVPAIQSRLPLMNRGSLNQLVG